MSDSALRPDATSVDELSPLDTVRRATQMSASLIDRPYKAATCSTDVWFSAFFDGTGNSLFDEDARPSEQQGYSNIALTDSDERMCC